MTAEDFIDPDPEIWLVVDGRWIKREWIRAELEKAWDEGEAAGYNNHGRHIRKETNPYRSHE